MTDTPTVTIQYTCHGCGIKWREVPVRERLPGEHITHWVEAAGEAVTEDHAKASPFCHSDKCDLKIPVPPTKDTPLGRAVRS